MCLQVPRVLTAKSRNWRTDALRVKQPPGLLPPTLAYTTSLRSFRNWARSTSRMSWHACFDFWKCQRTMDLFAIAVGRYHAGRFKDGQMLRDIRQRDAKRGLEIGNGLPALCEKVEHSETGRVGERFANAHLHFEDLFFRFRAAAFTQWDSLLVFYNGYRPLLVRPGTNRRFYQRDLKPWRVTLYRPDGFRRGPR